MKLFFASLVMAMVSLSATIAQAAFIVADYNFNTGTNGFASSDVHAGSTASVLNVIGGTYVPGVPSTSPQYSIQSSAFGGNGLFFTDASVPPVGAINQSSPPVPYLQFSLTPASTLQLTQLSFNLASNAPFLVFSAFVNVNNTGTWANIGNPAFQVSTPGLTLPLVPVSPISVSSASTIRVFAQGFGTPQPFYIDNVQLFAQTPSAVPAPAGLVLLLSGIPGLIGMSWYRRRNSASKTVA